jgi:hypothetical protein
VNLNWADDENSQAFDIDRDSLPLITGLVSSQYSDANVVAGASYTYVVTARGEMGSGFAVSDPVAVSTPAQCEITLPDPSVSVTAFAGRDISSFSGTPETTNRKPIISGTTNLPNAEISFLISDSTIVSAQTTANINGYWSWSSPIDLTRGNHTIFVTATDPLDPTRVSSDSLLFRIVKADEDEDEEDEEKKKQKETPGSAAPIKKPEKPAPPAPPEIRPLEFSLTVKPEQIFQGKELETAIRIERLAERLEKTGAIARYQVFDSRGEKKITILSDVILEEGGLIRRNIPIPKYFAKGNYRVQVEIIFDRYNLSRTRGFEVLEMPILDLGGGMLVTYPQLLSELGLIASILILLLLLWLILFSREYWLQLHALRHITERNLEKMGFISRKGKGVAR